MTTGLSLAFITSDKMPQIHPHDATLVKAPPYKEAVKHISRDLQTAVMKQKSTHPLRLMNIRK